MIYDICARRKIKNKKKNVHQNMNMIYVQEEKFQNFKIKKNVHQNMLHAFTSNQHTTTTTYLLV